MNNTQNITSFNNLNKQEFYNNLNNYIVDSSTIYDGRSIWQDDIQFGNNNNPNIIKNTVHDFIHF